MTAINNPTGDDVTYAYDGRGNLIKETSGATITNYAYDARDRLVSVALPGTTTAYSYNSDGHRIQENLNGTMTNFVWDELSRYGDVILETNASNVVQSRFVLGNGHLISQTKSSTTSYFLPDVQGSTRALTDSTGSLITGQTFDYSAFGDLVSTGTPNTDYLYTGQQFDTSTGLYSLRARYYDPGVGRFNSRDTWAYDFQNPVEFNRYVYAAGNPVRWGDPSGYMADYAGANKVSQQQKRNYISLGIAAYRLFGRIQAWMRVIEMLGQVLAPDRRITRDEPMAEDPTGGEAFHQAIEEILDTNPPGEPETEPEPTPEGQRPRPEIPDSPDRYHIALGMDPYLAVMWIRKLVPLRLAGIELMMYPSWQARGLTHFNVGVDFPRAYLETINNPKTEHIHFNLEGIINSSYGVSDYVSFSENWSGNGLYQQPFGRQNNFRVTAWELYWLRRNPAACMKTTFYASGSTSSPPAR